MGDGEEAVLLGADLFVGHAADPVAVSEGFGEFDGCVPPSRVVSEGVSLIRWVVGNMGSEKIEVCDEAGNDDDGGFPIFGGPVVDVTGRGFRRL